MANVTKWSSVGVAVQSALGANKTITAITLADPAVVTSNAHGLANGTYVVLTTTGMSQVNGRVFRIANQAANTFELEGLDSTAYSAFATGFANEITFGINMTTATGLTASGGEFDFIDTTTIHDNVRTQIPGLAAPASYAFENIWDAADAALIALTEASDTQGQRAVRFSFANGQKLVFNGYVGATLLPVGNAQDKVTTNVTITMFGRPTLYAT